MRRVCLFLIVLVGAGVPTAAAQVVEPWGRSADRSVALDALRPSFDGFGTTTLTTVNQLALHWPVARAVLVADLPFVYAKADGGPSGTLLIGNPFLGLASPSTSPFIGEVGVRIPVVSAQSTGGSLAQEIGLLADITDFDAYGEDLLTFRATAGYRHISPDHVAVRFAARPALLVPVGDYSGDPELFMDYGLEVGFETAQARLSVALNGRAIVTESGTLGERSVEEFAIGGSITIGQFRPGIVVRLPGSDLSDVLNYSVGVRLEAMF